MSFNGDFGDRKAKITARALHTIVMEYENDENDDDGAEDSSEPTVIIPDDVDESNGTTIEDECKSGQQVNGHDTNSDSDSFEHNNGRSERRKYEKSARPVTVYVGDATDGDSDRGALVAWSVKDARGIRVTLPVSVSTVDESDGRGERVDADDDDLDAIRNVLHLALIDEQRPAGQVVRYLYITYGRHPDAYKIPVDVIRYRRRMTNGDRPELRLTKCGARSRITGGNRCLINVGRKPVGPDCRPLVPPRFGVRTPVGIIGTARPSAVQTFMFGTPDGRFTRNTFDESAAATIVRDGGRLREPYSTKTVDKMDGRACDTGGSDTTSGGDDNEDYGDGICGNCGQRNCGDRPATVAAGPVDLARIHANHVGRLLVFGSGCVERDYC